MAIKVTIHFTIVIIAFYLVTFYWPLYMGIRLSQTGSMIVFFLVLSVYFVFSSLQI
jgi:hypothetical protein